MYLLKALGMLPFFLVLTTFSAVISVAAVHLDQLTPANFKESIATGTWFVEYFSPYCPHCKKFAPTWEKLVGEAKTEFPNIHLAQVNCVVHGDLCNDNSVKFYPSLFMYEGGKFQEEHNGERNLEGLKSFLTKYSKEQPKDVTAAVVLQEEVEDPLPKLNLKGEVLPIRDQATFTATLEQGPAFVKFFAPWCGHCQKLAPTWVQLAAHLKDKVTVAEVDCDAYSSLCAAQKIQGYPTLIYFAHGVRSEYTGGRTLSNLKAFAEKASQGRLHILHQDSELDKYIAEHDVVYLFLYSPNDPGILKPIREAAAALLGSPPVYTSSSPELFTRYLIPSSVPWALVALKDHDATKSAGHLYGSASTTDTSVMKDWLLTHRLPSSVELSSDTFQSVMNAPEAPLVVIASVTPSLRGKVQERMESLAREWRKRTGGSGEMNGKEVIWAWMDGEKWKDWLKSMYGISTTHADENDLDDVKIVIADHKNLIYYNEDASGHKLKLASTDKLFATLDKATAGKLSYKHSQNKVERFAHYLNHKLSGIEYYVSAHPFKSVFFIICGLVVIFYVLLKWLGNDVPTERDYYNKGARLD